MIRCSRIGLLLLTSLLAGVPSFAHAQERMDASATLVTKAVAPGEIFWVKVRLDVRMGFHTYPSKQKDPKASSFVAAYSIKEEKGPVELAGAVKEPPTTDHFDTTLKISVGVYEDPVDVEVPLRVKPGTPPGTVKFTLELDTQACDDNGCLPFSKSFDLSVTVKEGKPATASNTGGPVQPPSAALTDALGKSDLPAQVVEEETLWSFTLTGIVTGFFTLLTPCVFPMIPITISVFLKQEKSGQRTLATALVYSITIMLAMTFIAFAFVSFFQALLQDWPTNVLLGALFIVFALSLFGLFEITVPSFLTRWTSAGEAKGGYMGTVFMALTFTLISFSCVAPFLGAFAGVTAKPRPVSWQLTGALGFAAAFALPFFLLALFPALAKKLPRSGNWLNAMKVVMGFLEIAAALKFFRTAEISYTGADPQIFTYDLVLGLYVTLCLLAGLYLLGVYQMPHDEDEGSRKIGVGRLMWSLLFLGLAFYLIPGLFRAPDGSKLRPPGRIFAWVDSFLLSAEDTEPLPLLPLGRPAPAAPSPGSGNGGGATPTGLPGGNDTSAADLKWVGFLDTALNEARSKKQRIFIDFTGVT